MNLRSFSTLAGLLCVGTLLAQCGQPPDKTEVLRSAQNSGTQNPGGTDPAAAGKNANGTPAPGTSASKTAPTADQLAKSTTFFTNNIIPLVKGLPCSDCHNAPRLLKDPTINGGVGVQEHNVMFALLKDGVGANNNKLINKLLNVVPHKGGKVCADESAQPCGKIKEWYKAVFGDGVLALGKIESINREGSISGWVGSIDAIATTYEVKMFLDGPKGTGTALAPVPANQAGFDNGLDGNHAFGFKIPDAMIDAKAHKLYAYTTHNGADVELAGSPFDYQAFKPKTAAVATSFAQVNFNGCNGACHTFTYETRWGTLLGNGSDGTWTATSNSLYDKVSGKLGHGGPALPGGVNLTALQAWWTQEFGP